MSNANKPFDKQDFLITAILSQMGKKVNLKELTDEVLVKVALMLLVRDTQLFYSLTEEAKMVGSGNIICPTRHGDVIVTPAQFTAVRRAYFSNRASGPQLVEAIKTLRAETSMGLAEAKDAVEYMVNKNILREQTLADLLAQASNKNIP